MIQSLSPKKLSRFLVPFKLMGIPPVLQCTANNLFSRAILLQIQKTRLDAKFCPSLGEGVWSCSQSLFLLPWMKQKGIQCKRTKPKVYLRHF